MKYIKTDFFVKKKFGIRGDLFEEEGEYFHRGGG